MGRTRVHGINPFDRRVLIDVSFRRQHPSKEYYRVKRGNGDGDFAFPISRKNQRVPSQRLFTRKLGSERGGALEHSFLLIRVTLTKQFQANEGLSI